jgi:CRISPR-associated endonuclease/helicase Cas3/CRISPR-associated endonuclease Cas3-HD
LWCVYLIAGEFLYYAHTNNTSNKNEWQPLDEHLKNVAELAHDFAEEFNSGKLAYVAGLFHDVGKYSTEFQQRLCGSKFMVDHSTAGAKAVCGYYDNHNYVKILQSIITGHHGGLSNDDFDLKVRLNKTVCDYNNYKQEIIPSKLDDFYPLLTHENSNRGFCLSFYTRMLFSCLVDADFLDTEKYSTPEKAELRGGYSKISTLLSMFNNHMINILSCDLNNKINKHRREIFNQCIESAELQKQIFSLTVPTGGGKTLSSMGFALNHAKHHNLRKIFYVIPYTNIIEQNADVFRGIFGTENVLEHHSNYDTRKEHNTTRTKLRLASENWDMPITVTTNVQFFESLFSNKVSKCRKLHNLCNSVIILDEAQMIPIEYLKPCLMALNELVTNYGCSIVLCTATQPNLNKLLQKQPLEIIKTQKELYDAFKRVRVTNLGVLNDLDLSKKLNEAKQVLCIVNTKKHARLLYAELSKTAKCYHLTTKMCPEHRRDVFKEIKNKLKNGEECRVIATSLVEAGVDIDFPVVYRSLTGLDSINQAFGRCNREGVAPFGEAYIFESSEKHGTINTQSIATATCSQIMKKHDDIMSIDAINEYFELLYFFNGRNLDKKTILKNIEENKECIQFEKISDDFKLIADNTYDIIIPYDKNAEILIAKLSTAEEPKKYMRALQAYTVSVYYNELFMLQGFGVISTIADRFYVLTDFKNYYSDMLGLGTTAGLTQEMLFLCD